MLKKLPEDLVDGSLALHLVELSSFDHFLLPGHVCKPQSNAEVESNLEVLRRWQGDGVEGRMPMHSSGGSFLTSMQDVFSSESSAIQFLANVAEKSLVLDQVRLSSNRPSFQAALLRKYQALTPDQTLDSLRKW